MNVFHLTSVHERYDNRILNKECCSLAEKFNVTLIVADGNGLESYQGVNIVDAGKAKNRLDRILYKTFKVFNLARINGATVYHIHDPELIPVALIYRLFGKTIIYDIHEDYKTSIQQKTYLPVFVRSFMATFVTFLEVQSSRFFYKIIAEKYYSKRFEDAVPVLNYPRLGSFSDISSFDQLSSTLIYTGNVTSDRGAMCIAELASILSGYTIKVVGKCRSKLSEEMLNLASHNRDNLLFVGIDRYVPFPQIVDEYKSGALASLAIFPETAHYIEKELTKIFEYMAVGLPIIASDFPVWRALIVENEVGLCVDPEDAEAVANAVYWLRDHPQEAKAMGKRGQELVNQKYNWKCEARKLIDLYSSINM